MVALINKTMPASLNSRTIGALSWSMTQEVTQRGLQFIIGIFLARLLGPEQFGLLAMLTVFIAVSDALLDSGFSSALIQRKEPTEADESSVFYFNIVIGFLLAGGLCLAAPLIAAFYHQPQLISLMRVLALVLVINSISVVQSALMVRRLDFKRQALISVASTAISGMVGLVMAWRGFGVWSLVGQQLAKGTIRSGLLWLLSPWRPKWLFRLSSLKALFGFGSGMVASIVLNNLFENLYLLVIGKLFSPVTLGFYTRAATLQTTVSQSLAAVANRVTFPVFSRLQDDPARLKRGLHRAMTTIALVQFPMLIGLAAVAKPLVLFLLTEKWAASIPYLQLLCFAGLLYPMHLLNLNVLIATGHTDLLLRLEIIKRLLVVVNISITFRWGVLAMVWGQVINNIIAYYLNSYFTRRLIGYSLAEQLRDLYPYLAASTVMGIMVVWANLPLSVVYWLLCRGLRLPALAELSGIIRSRKFVPA
jgi:O-antigen/teichoic acid export membrane protein